jgi:hypothetical protein
MQVRPFNVETEYKHIQSWGEKQGWPMMPSKYYGLKGFISYDENTPVAVGFVYRDKGCPFCILEWVIGNPDVNWEIRKAGLDDVMESCFTWAKEDGAEVVLTMTKNKRLIEKYKEKSFVQTDDEMVHLVRRL